MEDTNLHNCILIQAGLISKDINCVTNYINDVEQDSTCLSIKSSQHFKLFGLPVSVKECLYVKVSSAKAFCEILVNAINIILKTLIGETKRF